jgi:hypothetical protein
MKSSMFAGKVPTLADLAIMQPGGTIKHNC